MRSFISGSAGGRRPRGAARLAPRPLAWQTSQKMCAWFATDGSSCASLRHVVVALYRDLKAAIVSAGEEVATMQLQSGIKQGCPPSATLSATTLEPLIRRHPFSVTGASSRTCTFVDDMRLAQAQIARQLRDMFALVRHLALASALPWNNQSACSFQQVTCLKHAPHFGAPGYEDVKVQARSKYLGVEVGPTAGTHQWAETLATARSRIDDVRGAQFQGQSLFVQWVCYPVVSMQGVLCRHSQG